MGSRGETPQPSTLSALCSRSGHGASGAGTPRRGREFSDSEMYKLTEAACWETARPGGHPHRELLAEFTALAAGAQAEDGYLHTGYGRLGQPARYSDLNFGHELYCAGHLLQA